MPTRRAWSAQRGSTRRSSKTRRSDPARLASGRFVLGLGANLGEREATLIAALAGLAAALGPLDVSSPYRSAAVPSGPRPDYLNAVAAGRTRLSVEAVAALAKSTEHRAGRRRAERWADRPLDVDLLLFGDTCRDDPELTIPHPRLRERAFVLAPLAELLPELPIPPDDATARELLARLDDRGTVERRKWSLELPAGVQQVDTAPSPCSSTRG